MMGWAIFFLIVVLIAAVFGYGGIAEISTDFAIIVFFVALALAVLSGIGSLFRGRR